MGPSTDERWALVAGGSGGIGSAIARALGADGWKVAITYRGNEERAARIVAELEAGGTAARALRVDLTDPEATAAVVGEVGDGLAGVVYAAGPTIRLDYLASLGVDEFAAALDGDLKACVNLLLPALPALRERGGSIVALSTQAAARYAKRDALSSVPKAGVDALLRAIATEEGRYGTRANTVGVGMIEGEGLWETFHQSGDYTDALLAAAMQATPMRRFGRPEDIAAMVRFLMSAEAGWVTGQTIYVDGGYTA